MLSSQGFDLWAEGYDKSVQQSDEDHSYPFAGYRQVLNTVYQKIRTHAGKSVLDVGFGTGILAQKLYQDGYRITGLDFSDQMLAIAKEKMPDASLYRHDFSAGYPDFLQAEAFDFIVCTYAIHHLEDPQKLRLINALFSHLSAGGLLLIGDVAFESAAEQDACRSKYEDEWDEDEFYMVKEVLQPSLPHMTFEKISFCAGVFTIGKP